MKSFEPKEHLDIPEQDLVSYIFSPTPNKFSRDQPIYIDAVEPKKRSISSNQAEKIIKQLVAGFKKAGLKTGDCVWSSCQSIVQSRYGRGPAYAQS